MCKTWSFTAWSFGVSLLFSVASVSAGIPTPKAQSPVSVSIEAATISQNNNGISIDFVVSASVKISTENLRLLIQPPQGMTLDSGALSWTGSAQRGEIKTLEFSASFTKSANQRLAARAVMQSSSKTRFSARAEYTVNAVAKIGNKLSNNIDGAPNSARTLPRGNGSVVEYALP